MWNANLLSGGVQSKQTDEASNLKQEIQQQRHASVQGKGFDGRHSRQCTCEGKCIQVNELPENDRQAANRGRNSRIPIRMTGAWTVLLHQ